jgi:hypothetical protein
MPFLLLAPQLEASSSTLGVCFIHILGVLSMSLSDFVLFIK